MTQQRNGGVTTCSVNSVVINSLYVGSSNAISGNVPHAVSDVTLCSSGALTTVRHNARIGVTTAQYSQRLHPLAGCRGWHRSAINSGLSSTVLPLLHTHHATRKWSRSQFNPPRSYHVYLCGLHVHLLVGGASGIRSVDNSPALATRTTARSRRQQHRRRVSVHVITRYMLRWRRLLLLRVVRETVGAGSHLGVRLRRALVVG